MNLSQMSYLVATVKCGNFSSAARELHVTPQTVSKSLNELERELGIRLFEKAGRNIRVTEEADLLAEKARNVLAATDDLKETANSLLMRAESHGRVTLAVGRNRLRGDVVVPELLDKAFARCGNIEITMLNTSSEGCFSAVQQGIADAAVVLGRTRRQDLEWTWLYNLRFCVALSNQHPLAQQELITPEDMKCRPIAMPLDLRCAYKVIDNWCAAHGIEPRFVQVKEDLEAHRAFLEAGGLIFVADGVQLRGQYPDCIVRHFPFHEGPHAPVCFIRKADTPSAEVRTLEKSFLLASRALHRTSL